MAILTTNIKENLLDLVCGLVAAEKATMADAIMEGTERIRMFEDDQTHLILNGVKHGHLIPILQDRPNANSFPFIDETECSTPECDVEIKGRAKKWELAMIGCQLPICLNKFDNEFMAWWGVNKKIFGEEDVNNVIVNYLRDKFMQSLNLAKYRASYFSDKDSTSVFLKELDGFFVQMEANPTQVVTITQNTGANYAAQLNLTGLDIYNYLTAMYDKMMNQYWQQGAVEFAMTRVTAQILVSYLNGLKDRTCCDGLQVLNADAITGARTFRLDNLSFNGIPIVVKDEWDYLINENTALNGGGANNARLQPHRIILTYRQNLLVGTIDDNHLEDFDIWYEKKEEKVYMRAKAYLGAAVPLDDYIIAI
jgi:hypothetical protein